MRRFTPVLVLALSLVAACAQPSATPAEIRERGKLVIGTEAEFAPFEYRTPDGGYAGFDMDLARMLAEELGVELEIDNMGFDGLMPALETGKVDLILSGMTATEERARTISFTDSYYVTGLCLLLNTESTEGVKSFEDLNDAKWTLAVKQSTTGEKVAKRLMPEAKLTVLQKETECALEVATGRADAFVYDKLSIVKNHREFPDTTRVILETFTTEPYAAGVRQNDVELREFVNAFLEKIKADGRHAALGRKHFPELSGD
jgi:polar amino acid transport system substrate-binding protein